MKTTNRIQKEEGVTRISLENARQLIAERGIPARVEIYCRGTGAALHGNEQLVEVQWPGEFNPHVFNGFSWGYLGDLGEGPRGLHEFFNMIDVWPRISRRQIAGWPEKMTMVLVRGADYDLPTGPRGTIGTFVVVTYPGPESTVADICFTTNAQALARQVKGGLEPTEIAGAFMRNREAVYFAHDLIDRRNKGERFEKKQPWVDPDPLDTDDLVVEDRS